MLAGAAQPPHVADAGSVHDQHWQPRVTEHAFIVSPHSMCPRA
jgi:hypothetical protein